MAMSESALSPMQEESQQGGGGGVAKEWVLQHGDGGWMRGKQEEKQQNFIRNQEDFEMGMECNSTPVEVKKYRVNLPQR